MKKNTLQSHLTMEEKNRLLEQIRIYFKEERDEELGIIAAEKVYDFFIEHMGTLIYNKGLDDGKFWFFKRLEDLEVDFDQLKQ